MTMKTERVDTWDMLVVHRWFRREFRQAPDLVSGVAAGDRDRATLIAQHIADQAFALHHHHTGEDDLLWPKLLERATLHQDLVHRMEAQHERLATLLERVDTLLPAWRDEADVATRDRLAATLTEASAALDEHLGEEESELLPIVPDHLTVAEWEALGERGVESLPKNSKAFVYLGLILEDTSPPEQARFLGNIPAPIRFAWRVFGRGIYRKYMVRLHAA